MQQSDHIYFTAGSDITVLPHPGILPTTDCVGLSIYYWKISLYKWTHAVQTHVVQGSTLRPSLISMTLKQRSCLLYSAHSWSPSQGGLFFWTWTRTQHGVFMAPWSVFRLICWHLLLREHPSSSQNDSCQSLEFNAHIQTWRSLQTQSHSPSSPFVQGLFTWMSSHHSQVTNA